MIYFNFNNFFQLLTIPLIIALGFLTAIFFYLGLLRFIKKLFFGGYERYCRWHFRERSFWPTLLPNNTDRWRNLLGWAGWHGLSLRPTTLVIFSLSAAGCSAIFFPRIFAYIFLVLPVIFYLTIKTTAAKRVAEFREQLPDVLSSLSDAMRSGFSFTQALIFIAREVPPPLQDILQALIRSHDLRLPLAQAFIRLGEQIAVPEWHTISAALVAQQSWGGNVLPLLEETAKTLRERLAVEKEIITLTAAGRLSGWLVTALTPIVLIFFFIVSPDYLSIMFISTIGRLLLTLAIALQILGFFWIRHLTRVDY